MKLRKQSSRGTGWPAVLALLLVVGLVLPIPGHAQVLLPPGSILEEAAGLPPAQELDPRIPLPELVRPVRPVLPQPTVPQPPPQVECGAMLTEIKAMRLNVVDATEACILLLSGTPARTVSLRLRPLQPQMRVEFIVTEEDGNQLAYAVAESPSDEQVLRFTFPPSGRVVVTVIASRPGLVSIEPFGVMAMIFGPTCGGELEPGDVLNHLMKSLGEQCWYTFDGRAGDVVVVSMTTNASDLDPLLKLYDEVGATLSTDDDGGGDRNARLMAELPENQTYTIVARDYANHYGGSFQLRFEVGQGPEDCGGQIAAGQTVTGELAGPDQECAFTFSGTRNQVVTLTARKTGGTLDTILSVYGPDYPGGTPFASNDDSSAAGGVNSQVAGLRLPATQRYHLVVSSWGGTTGPFTLEVKTP